MQYIIVSPDELAKYDNPNKLGNIFKQEKNEK